MTNASVIAGRKKIGITFNPPSDYPLVPLDPAKFQQVIDNLLSNSIKYSFPDTTITVTLSLENNQPRVVIEDQGAGHGPGSHFQTV